MVSLRVLTGRQTGTELVARHFPVTIGRASGSDLVIEGDGTWDEHFEVDWDRPGGIRIHSLHGALTLLNGKPVQSANLRNGDLIETGSTRLQFWICPACQAGLKLREILTWSGFLGVVAIEVTLMFALT